MITTNKRLAAGPYLVDRECYTDEAVFDRELSNIFEKTWTFVAHSSELAKPGDYRTGEIAGQPIITIMGADKKIRVFYNSCRHKATLLLTDRMGRCDHIRCPYHHWTYDTQGNLVRVPRVEAYGPDFDLAKTGLIELPSVGEIYGLIFASMNPNIESIESYVGSAAPYLKEVALYTDEELDTIGIYDYLYDGNWKLLMENTVDDYHAEYLHDYAFAQRAKLFNMGQGSGGFAAQEGRHHSVELGFHGAFDQHDDERTLVIQKVRTRRVYLNIFPTLIVLYNPVWDVTAFRVIVPIAVDKTRVLNYVLVPKSADKDRRRQIGERFHYSWGPGGRAGVDDINIFSQVQRGLKARGAGQVITSRGYMRPGPVGGPADDHAVRAFWFGWRTMMADVAEASNSTDTSHRARMHNV